MAERRMFTKLVTEEDNFISLSSSAQALFLHLSMAADDDGFCNQVTTSMFRAHASTEDLRQLLERRYLYQFQNGVMVIRQWRMANALRKDRYTPTIYQEELKQLGLKDDGSYTWLPDGCQMVAERLPQDRLGKDSIGNNKEYIPASEQKKEPKSAYGEYKHVMLTQTQYAKLCETYPEADRYIAILDEYIEEKGTKYKNHYLVITKKESWVRAKAKGTKAVKPTTFNQFSQRTDDLDAGVLERIMGKL